MSSFLMSVIKFLLGIADKLAAYMERRQLMEAGRAKQQKKAIERMRNALDKANHACHHAQLELDNGGVPKDSEYYRD